MVGSIKNFIQSRCGVSLAPFFLLIFCFISRVVSLGNPLIDVDEGFYLFVGGQMLHGAVPFVDVWDRKPFGIFLLYAFFHLFGPYRILAYQIGALISVWLTSILLMKMARKIAPLWGAFIAALLYIGSLNLASGDGGQSPVFYNLLVVYGMYHILTHIVGDNKNISDMRGAAYKAMLLFGLSLQIKYTTVFEGAFAGIFLLWAFYRKTKSVQNVVVQALFWIVLALFPTTCVAITYWVMGYGHEWWFANVISIFYRGHLPQDVERRQAIKMLLVLLPFLLGILLRKMIGLKMTFNQKAYVSFIDIWTFSALFAVAIFGTWYIHYALPLFAPLAVALASLWSKKIGKIWLLLLLLYTIIAGQIILIQHDRNHGGKAFFRNIVSILSHPEGCVFIYSGSAIFYDFTKFCNLTTHPFPGHFRKEIERQAIGINPLLELQHIIKTKPMYILSAEPATNDENMQDREFLYEKIQSDYHRIYTSQKGKSSISVYKINADASGSLSPPAAIK